ncbi:hypothetical protein Pfo_025137 [Paulownia fortunei]|nr:hypothetical protein Pfo_025137 [Paulownia fortunei]
MSNLTSITTLEYTTPSSSASTGKRQKHRHHNPHEAEDHHQSLLPGLPDHIAQLCLSLVPPSTLYSVCRSWRRLIYSPSFPPFLSLYALLSSTEIHSTSQTPYNSPRLILYHLPIQSVSVSGNLVLLAATTDQFLPALSQPLVFNPLSQKWAHGPPLSAPRRWCAAGASCGVVYVASGIGSHYDNDLRDAKFSREAIDAVGWKGKLCMVNVKGDAAKEGIIYDVETDSWEEMPEGMLAGWRGPAAAMEEETIYVVDESKGWLKKYDHLKDAWVEVVKNKMLTGAQQVVAAGGRVCVLCADGLGIAVVDVAALPPARLWMVEVPPEFQAVGIHVLPRLCHPDV